MDPVFLQAALISPPEIFGRRLRPFSAGHVLVLSALESPYVSGTEGAAVTFEDLVRALYVCSHTFEENRERCSMVPGGLDPERSERVSRECIEWIQAAAPTPEETAAAFETFEAYLREYRLRAEHGDVCGRKINHWRLLVPGPYAIVIGIVRATYGAVSLAEAWDMPLGLAFAYIDTADNLQGDMTLLDEQRRANLEALKDAPEPRKRGTPTPGLKPGYRLATLEEMADGIQGPVRARKGEPGYVPPRRKKKKTTSRRSVKRARKKK